MNRGERGWQDSIRRLACAVRPAEVLCLGPEARELLAATGLALRPVDPDVVLGPPGALPRADLALVAGLLEDLSKARGAAVLSRLRDVHARRLLVKVTLGNNPDVGWTRNQMLGLGLSEVLRQHSATASVGIYHFNLYDYKLTPDWFNARNWAHPELWKP